MMIILGQYQLKTLLLVQAVNSLLGFINFYSIYFFDETWSELQATLKLYM